MTSRKFEETFGGRARQEGEPLTKRHMDLAASVQKVTEEIMLRITRDLSCTYGIKNLCLAGGVALNCVANGKVLRDRHFERVWIQPAAGDAGGALGAALAEPSITCSSGSRASSTARSTPCTAATWGRSSARWRSSAASQPQARVSRLGR